MRLGTMNRRVTIRQPTAPTRNAMNEPVTGWTTLGTFWAQQDERQSRATESTQAGQTRAQLTRVWELRWTERTAQIGLKDRAVCEGVEYEIEAVTEVGRRAGIRITATGPVPL